MPVTVADKVTVYVNADVVNVHIYRGADGSGINNITEKPSINPCIPINPIDPPNPSIIIK